MDNNRLLARLLQKRFPDSAKEPAPLTRITKECLLNLSALWRRLAKDREERYQTGKDLQVDLRNLKRKLEVNAEIDRTVPPELRAATSPTSGDGRVPVTNSAAALGTASAGISHSPSSAEFIVSGIKQHKLAAAVA